MTFPLIRKGLTCSHQLCELWALTQAVRVSLEAAKVPLCDEADWHCVD